MKNLFLLSGVLVLSACAAQPAGLNVNALESERYLVTERRRLPIDFAEVQKNLFEHQRLCGQTYTFQMVPRESSFARVVYQPEGTSGWENAVVLSMVRLHNRSINVKAYSYYSGQLGRVQQMFSAFMKPESCQVDSSWENSVSD